MTCEFNLNTLSFTINKIKESAEKCNKQMRPRGVKRHVYTVIVYDANNTKISEGVLFKDFKKVVEEIRNTQNGRVETSCCLEAF